MERNRRIPDVMVYVTGCMDSAITYSIVQGTISLLDIKNDTTKQQQNQFSHFLPYKLMSYKALTQWYTGILMKFRFTKDYSLVRSEVHTVVLLRSQVFWNDTVLLG